MLNFEITEHGRRLGVPIKGIVGDIPYFASESNPDTLIEQFNKSYSFGGGWQPFEEFVMDIDGYQLEYPGDLPLKPMAIASFRNQKVIVYLHSWVAIVEEDGTFEVSRMD